MIAAEDDPDVFEALFRTAEGSRSRAVHRLVWWLGDFNYRVDIGRDEAVALSKLWISEAAVQSGLDAIQIFGAAGVATDTGIDALLRDAVPSRIFSGTSEMQRAIIARMMGIR